jgi:hypothetical protein
MISSIFFNAENSLQPPLAPADKIKDQTQYDTQKDARRDREIKGEVLLLDNDIPRKLAQKGDAAVSEQEKYYPEDGDYYPCDD